MTKTNLLLGDPLDLIVDIALEHELPRLAWSFLVDLKWESKRGGRGLMFLERRVVVGEGQRGVWLRLG